MYDSLAVVTVLTVLHYWVVICSMENDESKTPLLKAIDGRHASMVGRLISAGARLDTADCWGTPPLLSAVFSGDPATVCLLIQGGCSVNESMPNNPCVNPLSESLSRALSITVMLVAAGCNVRQALQLPQQQHPVITERKQWLLDLCTEPQSLQVIARNVIRNRLKHFQFRRRERTDGIEEDLVVDKLQLLCRSGYPKRICSYIKCMELDDILRMYEP